MREAVKDDIPALLELARQMIAESRYKNFTMNEYKLTALLDYLIDKDTGFVIVFEKDGEIIGGFVGSITEQFFSDAKVASDYALFVSPDKRGALIGIRAIKAFIEWAKKNGADDIVISQSTGVKVEQYAKMCEFVGLQHVGNNYAIGDL